MSEPSLLKVPCDCGTFMRVTETGSGAISLSCPSCKSQSFKKSPAAVAAFKAKFGSGSSSSSTSTHTAKKSGGFLDEL